MVRSVKNDKTEAPFPLGEWVIMGSSHLPFFFFPQIEELVMSDKSLKERRMAQGRKEKRREATFGMWDAVFSSIVFRLVRSKK